MKINDVLSGLLIGSFGAAIYLHARSFPPLPGQNVGPNMFPQLIATGLGWLGQGRIALGFLLIPLVLVFYVAVSESLGFLPTAVILLMTLFLVFKVRLRTAIVVAVLGALCIHTLFYKLLKVPLPWGLLKSVAW